MFFRNLTLFRFPPPAHQPRFLDSLVRGIVETQLKPVGPLELASRGFISPFGGDSEVLMHTRDDLAWVTLGGEDRMLPSSVVDAELRKRMAKIEADEGRKPGGKTRKAIKDDIVHEFLPRAFVRPSRTDGYLDLSRGLVVVDTASRKVAEAFVSHLRLALGSFPALPLNAELAPRAVLTEWLADAYRDNALPAGFTLGDEAILKDAADKGAAIRATGQELQAEEITRHLEAGKQVTRLGLQTDHLSFTLDEDLVLRKFKLLDGAIDSLESTERDDLMAELDARFALLTLEVGHLFDLLEPALKLSRAEA